MKAPEIEPMRHGVIGYGCNGGYNTDHIGEADKRPHSHFTLSRANWKRSYRHAQRRRWKSEITRED